MEVVLSALVIVVALAVPVAVIVLFVQLSGLRGEVKRLQAWVAAQQAWLAAHQAPGQASPLPGAVGIRPPAATSATPAASAPGMMTPVPGAPGMMTPVPGAPGMMPPAPPAPVGLPPSAPRPAPGSIDNRLADPRTQVNAVPPPPPPPGGVRVGRKVVGESFIGRSILPLIAAALGFIGLVFLAILIVPHLTDGIKIALMFALSLAVGALGYWLNRRRRSLLTQALTGTGLGGLFISVLVTHLYFHAISDVVAFTGLAIWTIGGMALSKHLDSLLIAILAHAGMVVSIVMAYVGWVTDDKLVLVIAYQVVVTLTIIIGNAFWIRKMYRYGLFASQLMIIVSVAVMLDRLLWPASGIDTGLPPAVIGAAFLVQFTGASAVAYLLFVSTAREKVGRAALAALNSALWTIILVTSVTVPVTRLVDNQSGLSMGYVWNPTTTIPWSVGITLVLAFIPLLAMALADRPVGLKADLQLATALPPAGASAGLLILYAIDRVSGSGPAISWIIGLAVACLVLGLVTGSATATWLARGLLVADAVVMLVPWIGYASLTYTWTIWASLGYLLVLVGLAFATWRQLPPTRRERYASALLIAVFLGIEASLAAILFFSELPKPSGWFVVITVGLLALLHFVIKARPVVFYRIAELVAVFLTAGTSYSAARDYDWWAGALDAGSPYGHMFDNVVAMVLAGVAAAGLIIISLDRIRLAARAASLALRNRLAHPAPASRLEGAQEILSGIVITVAVIGLLAPYDWFMPPDGILLGPPASLACMAVALVITALGLWSRVKPLRLYGLVLLIICVLKLVTIDIGSVGSITRVVAFLGGAAICFGISALYNYAAKHFDKELGADEPGDPPLIPPAVPAHQEGATPAPQTR